MKFVVMFLFVFSTAVHANAFEDDTKRHRAERHEEKKKWSQMSEECKAKFPMSHDTKHADYDGRFKCDEAVEDAEKAFEKKQNKELCDKHNVGCKNL